MGWKKEKEIFENAFGEGSKKRQVVIRVTETMEKALEAEASVTGQNVADIARTAISFYLIPGFLKRRLDSGIGLETSNLYLIEVYRKFLVQLNEMCNEIEGKQKSLELKAAEQHFAEVVKQPLSQQMMEQMVRRIVDDLFKEKRMRKPKESITKKSIKKI